MPLVFITKLIEIYSTKSFEMQSFEPFRHYSFDKILVSGML
jgi:hypothetical protein